MPNLRIPDLHYQNYLRVILAITSPLILCQWHKLQSSDTRWDSKPSHARSSLPSQLGLWTFHIDINNATASDFELLEKIGPALANRIIGTRKTMPNQRFKTLNELLQVKGIGNKTLEKLRSHLICR